MNLHFDWDPAKNRANLRKHGVAFEEAASVFYDDAAIQFFDDGHSEDEDRFLMLGMSAKARVLLVCHCEREVGSVIRIISARRATVRERKLYKGDLL